MFLRFVYDVLLMCLLTAVHTSATQLGEITAQLMVDVKNIPPTAPSPYSFGNTPNQYTPSISTHTINTSIYPNNIQ